MADAESCAGNQAPDARELAITLFAGVQGGSLLASALRDPDLLTGHVHRIEQWIDTLA
jgi:hypothetical protein